MAESAVTSVLDKLIPFLSQEVNLLTGVRQEVEFIRDELCSIQGVLREADAREESKDWVNQVRDIAYDIEDTIDEFNLRLQQHQGHGFLGFLYKTVKLVKHLKPRHHLATQIQSIKSRVHDVYERRQRYEFNFHDQGSSANALRDTWQDHRGGALQIKEDELVGIDKPREKLIEWLVGGESRLEVISMYGMPGSGKTSLVKKVYDQQRVIQHFQHHVWINVSQSFKIKELIKDMIKQLYGEIKESVPQGVDTMDEDSLKTTVNVFLQQKRYVVILDDIWSIHAWDAVKYALPDSNCSSRIMVTTRSYDIASFCKGLYGHVYNLESLASEDSWTLFCKKAFGENSCPPELLEFSKNILKRCGGIPLAIVAICSFLSTKEKTMIEWEIVHRSLGSLVQSNDKLENMKEILSLSYNDLPYYLKPCLLYLGFFPEDYLIESSRLIKLWTAEGFISEKEGVTVEEVAERHLHELINRSLIQVAETNREGRVKRCRVHDFIREIILSKLRDQNCGAIATKHHTKFPPKVRWLSIHNSVDSVPENKSFSHLRSLFIFGVNSIPKSYVQSFFSSSRLLRVLDLRDAPLEKLPNEIVNLFSLRYLSLRRTKIKNLPKMMGKLQNLETLDLKGTSVCKLPSKLFKIQQLRHLIAYKVQFETYSDFWHGFDGRVGIRRLVNLQELLYIDVDVYQGGRIVRELGELIQLRRLGVLGMRKEYGVELCSSIEKMKNLCFLDVTSSKGEVLDLQSLSSPPMLLQRLELSVNLEKFPNWISSLLNLKKLYLGKCGLSDDPLGVLQALPNLVELTLHQTYDGEELCLKGGGFLTLKVLYFHGFERLKLVRVEEGAMPHLEVLHIMACKMLEKVPLGIECLANLKFLYFAHMPKEFAMALNPTRLGGGDWMCVNWRNKHLEGHSLE
ncbi:hypothetical protein HHK36_031703 [Tetracentron sinense]|uniref:Disease resistance protein RPM1-like n=1 Tax=Tetracentron sinense TaxID=13715 RepID=A0A835CXT7_TETSI|nr:hypothetical protein HHK36_031703 [Tetracentron sinense]